MKIALLGHGQPRFTQAFIILQQQLKGFDQADFYMCLWADNWVQTPEQARTALEPHILPGYKLKDLIVTPQPQYQLPPHKLEHIGEEKESIRWWYKRRWGMWLSLKMAYDLIKEQYDIVIKFRPDGRLDREIDLRTLDMSKGLIFPNNHLAGLEAMRICDQFVFGTQIEMKFYSDLINNFDNYILALAPDRWEYSVHNNWSSEHILGAHMLLNNKSQFKGDYQHLLRVDGTSPNDDHWYQGK
jgi:hypothetical protein